MLRLTSQCSAFSLVYMVVVECTILVCVNIGVLYKMTALDVLVDGKCFLCGIEN